MKNMNFMYLMDQIDDKYIVEAKMLPKSTVIAVDPSRFTSFFTGAVSVAATVLILGAIFIWTLVGKDILGPHHGGDNTSSDETTDSVTTEPIVYSEGLDIKLTYDHKGCVVAGIGTCTDTEIVIPLEYMGLPIVKIENNAFYKCTNITSVTITSNVTAIGKSAFSGCEALKKVKIANSVTTISSGAFMNCDKLTDVNIPTELTILSDSVFSGCDSLKNITIPDGVTDIEASAFSDTALTSVTVPDSVTHIGKGVFYNCKKLESITLPFVGEKMDRSGYTNFGYIFGTTSDNSQVPKSLKNVVITGGSILDDNAFKGCSGIASITLPNNLLFVGHYVFQNCKNLEKIVIPKSVTYVGSRAFLNCSKATIYCAANKQPAEWDTSWNYDNRPLVWGYTGDNS